MKLVRILAPLLSLTLLTACRSQPEAHSVQFFAMDTVMTVSAWGGGGQEAAEQARDVVDRLDALLSVTDETSELYAANHSGGRPVSLSPETAQVLEQALDLCRDSRGALDITLYPVVKAWGFTTDSCTVPDDAALIELLERVDWTRVSLEEDVLTLPAGMELDLGAVAKGFAADRAAESLRAAGVSSALLDLGGNIQAVGSRPDGSPWRVAVQDPDGGWLGVLEVADQAVVTSGGYQRYFEEDGERYWHILDPATGRPARSGLTSATAVGPGGAVCDGLSTTLFVLGLEESVDLWRQQGDFEFLLLTEEGELYLSSGLADAFTPEAAWEGRVTVVEP
mgnify:CR=1 FL=1